MLSPRAKLEFWKLRMKLVLGWPLWPQGHNEILHTQIGQLVLDLWIIQNFELSTKICCCFVRRAQKVKSEAWRECCVFRPANACLHMRSHDWKQWKTLENYQKSTFFIVRTWDSRKAHARTLRKMQFFWSDLFYCWHTSCI